MDPEGYYARLGVAPDAEPSEIAAAYRAKARLLHPDVPVTGDAGAFILLHEAYEILGDEVSRARYDRSARDHAARRPAPEWAEPPPTELADLPELPSILSNGRLRLGLWIGLVVLTSVSLIELAIHVTGMLATPLPAPLAARLSALPDPAPPPPDGPMTPTGTPTHYVLPTGGPAPLWRYDPVSRRYLPAARLEPFTGVAVLDAPERDGMLEIRVSAGQGFIDATRLAPGGVQAARRAYCGYNAGPPLTSGEVLVRHGSGDAALTIENANAEPAVLKLRDAQGAVALSVHAPQGVTQVAALAPGAYTVEYATGTLWSRACGRFIAGQRAWRLPAPVSIASDTRLTIPLQTAAEIPPDAFSND